MSGSELFSSHGQANHSLSLLLELLKGALLKTIDKSLWSDMFLVRLVRSGNYGNSGNRETQIRNNVWKLRVLLVRLNMKQKGINLEVIDFHDVSA